MSERFSPENSYSIHSMDMIKWGFMNAASTSRRINSIVIPLHWAIFIMALPLCAAAQQSSSIMLEERGVPPDSSVVRATEEDLRNELLSLQAEINRSIPPSSEIKIITHQAEIEAEFWNALRIMWNSNDTTAKLSYLIVASGVKDSELQSNSVLRSAVSAASMSIYSSMLMNNMQNITHSTLVNIISAYLLKLMQKAFSELSEIDSIIALFSSLKDQEFDILAADALFSVRNNRPLYRPGVTHNVNFIDKPIPGAALAKQPPHLSYKLVPFPSEQHSISCPDVAPMSFPIIPKRNVLVSSETPRDYQEFRRIKEERDYQRWLAEQRRIQMEQEFAEMMGALGGSTYSTSQPMHYPPPLVSTPSTSTGSTWPYNSKASAKHQTSSSPSRAAFPLPPSTSPSGKRPITTSPSSGIKSLDEIERYIYSDWGKPGHSRTPQPRTNSSTTQAP